MASISKTPAGTYAVSYRSNGKQFKRTFKDKQTAVRFRDVVDLNPQAKATRVTVGSLMEAYRDERTVLKRGARSESLRLTALTRRPFAQIRLDKLTRQDLQAFVDRRATEVAPATVHREIDTLSAVFTWAKEKELILENPTKGLRLPKMPEHRERVASKEDIDKLLLACRWDGVSPPRTRMQTAIAAFLFSCYTGMRSGEITQLEESWIDGCVIHLPAPVTKTASKRDVALGQEALRILNLVRAANGSELFQMTAARRDVRFRSVRDKAGLGPVFDSQGNVIKEGLHFHDGRATFATWAASPDPETGAPRLDVMALARQTGHKDLKMLMRYYRATAEEIAKRLK